MHKRATLVFYVSLAASIGLAARSFAQPIIDYDSMPEARQSIIVDLDNDGRNEIAQAFSLNDSFDIITVRPAQTDADFDFDAAFTVPINLSDFESLERLPNGNMRVTWGCFACGRTHSHSSIVIDGRDGDLVVIGYDNSYADRLYAAVFSCSVNFLTGDAIVEADDVERRNLTTSDRAYPANTLSRSPLPQVCRDAYARYDDAFMAENFPNE